MWYLVVDTLHQYTTYKLRCSIEYHTEYQRKNGQVNHEKGQACEG